MKRWIHSSSEMQSYRPNDTDREEYDDATPDKYILYTPKARAEYDTFEEALKAYNNCSESHKFLYQPDKTYFLGTLSSTGYKVGHDHKYHKDIAKCYGLFIADNPNQISRFLTKVDWHHQGSSRNSSKARLYGNGPYGSLYSSNSNDGQYGWDYFDSAIQRNYLAGDNICYFHKLSDDFGAIDVTKADKYIGSYNNPYRLH